jgi:uncharacterized protein YfaS (alpha-2-macroglobulin family)
LQGVAALIQNEKTDAIDVQGTVTVNNAPLLQGNFKGFAEEPAVASFDFSSPEISALPRDAALPLEVNRAGQGNLYYSVSMNYALPSEMQIARDEGFCVSVSIYDVESGTQVDGGELEAGKTYRMEASISSTMDRTYAALRLPVPSGAEILDNTFVTTARYRPEAADNDEKPETRQSDYSVLLDNEAQYFWDSFPKGQASAVCLFRAVRRGVYPTPPAVAECMYESEIFGKNFGNLYFIK